MLTLKNQIEQGIARHSAFGGAAPALLFPVLPLAFPAPSARNLDLPQIKSATSAPGRGIAISVRQKQEQESTEITEGKEENFEQKVAKSSKGGTLLPLFFATLRPSVPSRPSLLSSVISVSSCRIFFRRPGNALTDSKSRTHPQPTRVTD